MLSVFVGPSSDDKPVRTDLRRAHTPRAGRRPELQIGVVVIPSASTPTPGMTTAMALEVTDVYYGLESPADGGSMVAATWPTSPDLPWYVAPKITGGIHRRGEDQFRRYCDRAPDSGFRTWANTRATLPDR